MLQLANLDGLSTYLFGSSADASQLPLIRSFRATTAPAAETLERVVEEHSSWLQVNCDRQLTNYRFENLATVPELVLWLPSAVQSLDLAYDWHLSSKGASQPLSSFRRG